MKDRVRRDDSCKTIYTDEDLAILDVYAKPAEKHPSPNQAQSFGKNLRNQPPIYEPKPKLNEDSLTMCNDVGTCSYCLIHQVRNVKGESSEFNSHGCVV